MIIGELVKSNNVAYKPNNKPINSQSLINFRFSLPMFYSIILWLSLNFLVFILKIPSLTGTE